MVRLWITMSKAELIASIVTRDYWLRTEDYLARRPRKVIDEGSYWSKSEEELDKMLAERDAELKGIYFNILRRHQLAAAGKDDYSVEMMRQSVVQLRQAPKQDWEVMLT
ncbi:hypothetical protein F66182_12516 [Fusarium sp. NRRL 66182]|nr:hypothetical protein F66182_12516 [Fusarium sp. NRRL 66182]